jgi:hypothetical protein
MVKYRIKFKFEKEDKTESNRDNLLNDILSDIDNIISDEPIRKPLEGEAILISGVEYLVNSVFISFEKEGEITYYDFVVSLYRKLYKEKKDAEKEQKRYEEIFKDLYEKYETKKFSSSKYYTHDEYKKWFINKNI